MVGGHQDMSSCVQGIRKIENHWPTEQFIRTLLSSMESRPRASHLCQWASSSSRAFCLSLALCSISSYCCCRVAASWVQESLFTTFWALAENMVTVLLSASRAWQRSWGESRQDSFCRVFSSSNEGCLKCYELFISRIFPLASMTSGDWNPRHQERVWEGPLDNSSSQDKGQWDSSWQSLCLQLQRQPWCRRVSCHTDTLTVRREVL